MNKFEWAELVIKFGAIFLFILLLFQLPTFIFFSTGPGVPDNFIFIGISFLVYALFFLLAYLLWNKSSSLSHQFWKQSNPTQPSESPNLEEIQTIVFSAIGIYIVISTLPDIIIPALKALVSHNQGVQVESKIYIVIVSECIKMGLGIWLLLSAQGIIRFLVYLINYPDKEQH